MYLRHVLKQKLNELFRHGVRDCHCKLFQNVVSSTGVVEVKFKEVQGNANTTIILVMGKGWCRKIRNCKSNQGKKSRYSQRLSSFMNRQGNLRSSLFHFKEESIPLTGKKQKGLTLMFWYMESQREMVWLSTLGSNYQVPPPPSVGGSNLTGPVISSHLSSMVINDQPRFETCYQIALAILRSVSVRIEKQ